jgi:hypothetical protein
MSTRHKLVLLSVLFSVNVFAYDQKTQCDIRRDCGRFIPHKESFC